MKRKPSTKLFGARPSRRDVVKLGALTAAGAFMLPYRAALAQDTDAEVIFRGGNILTMDPANARAEALAVRGGRIVAVGSQAEIDTLSGSNTRVVDLDGRTLMPGMIDSHAHTWAVVKDDYIIISPTEVSSFDEVMQKLTAGAAELNEGEWLLAADYDGVVTPGGRQFTLEDLNGIAPNNPFLILEGSGHVAYANSLALQLAGIDKNTPDPVASRYVKDENGELTGRLEEAGAFAPVINIAQTLTDQEMEMRTLRMLGNAARVGLTCIGDPSVGQNKGLEDVLLLQRIRDRAPTRHRAFLVSTEMDLWAENGIGMGYGDDKFRVAKMKAWSDGATQAYSSFLREPYLGSESNGALNYTEDQLYEVVSRAHGDGFSLAVHGNGDGAIDLVLRVYERVLSENPRNDHRHRIEHCSIGHPDQYQKMKELGVSPTYLSGHIRWWGKAFRDDLLGPDRVAYYDAAATAVEMGIPFSMHSDYSVSPLGPLRCVQDMVTRVMADGGEVFAPDQRIPVEEALKGVTSHAAWQLHMDDIAGSLETGKYADLAILENDPTAVDSMQIENIAISETWLEGVKQDVG